DEMMTFLMAGHETTSTALAWALALLSRHPEARERLAEEVDSALGGSVPTAEGVASLAWTRAVVQEALRLCPPLWTIERDAVGDEELDGVAIPAGSTVVVSPYLVHRNPDVWPNPEGFQPERFLPEAGADRHRLAFIPFGAGRRGCIGRGFALLEATIALAVIAQRWELDLLPGGVPLPEASVTLRPRGGLPMALRRRRRADAVPAAAAPAAPLGRVVPRRSLPGILRRLLHDPLGSMTRLLLDHGDLVELPFPGHRAFVLARPEHVEHVLVTRQDNYTIAFTYRLLKVFLGSGMITAEGEEYARQRRLVQPLFGHQRVAALAPPMAEATLHSLRSWDRLPDGSTLDAAAAMSALTLDIVGRTLFGADLTGATGAVLPAVATLQRAALPVARNPLVWLAPRAAGATTPSYWRYAAAMRTLHRVVARVMAERLATPAPEEPRDVLDVLLSAGRDDRAPTERQVRDEMMTFFMAGHETTANALAWTLALLSIHPWAWERLRAEVDAALGGRVPTAEDAASLVWTRAVLQEAMRLYPPVWTIERDAVGDDELDGVAIPAGSTVVVSPYLVHRNPDVWPNPEGFRPERFLPEASQARHRLSYIAFGAGHRGCVGRGFALLEAAIALAMITQRYRLDLAPGARPVPEVSVTLRPRGGLPMTLRRVG
ncbi:MAG TPA: cytochrome P450, partial [Candidatus Eisenbacteria bacterium]|nr:cytochrome P450 [Candidatus Eisenbacteria bacterium]